MNELEFLQIRAVSLAVVDASRARQFYAETLGLKADDNIDLAFKIGEVLLLLSLKKSGMVSPRMN